ncbi:DNA primase [Lacticaseibacillus hulanensis]|uniref:DNA primase n=1 Tax=Lacticaseibacillus hulanensis TaxID=2493111 RepID=UPI001F4E7773|nr:DNA primase [Lacticaseibacillus hulanensis]
MAGMVPTEKIDEIRAAVNIADYIGQYVALEKRGQNLFGLCPFVPEKTPSFTVTEQKQLFKCFSCSRGGDVFKFVMEYDHLDFIHAVKKVADYAGIALDVNLNSGRPENPAVRQQKNILAQVTDFFHHLLINTDSGRQALSYLHERGLTDETIDAYGLGFAPEDGDLLVKFLNSKDISRDEQRQTGLLVDRSNGGLYARFTNRVMFPLRNERGETIGFSGRTLSGDKTSAKYLNSPETVIFNKSDVLFNLDKALNTPGNTDKQLILFEGYMDVISAYQAGVTNGIASMGTSLTPKQVQSIARHTDKVTICYDGDAPGQKAISRALGMFEGTDVDVGVTFLPDNLDPDEFIQKRGAKAFADQLKVVLTPTAFRLHHLASGVDMFNDHAKLQYIKDALTVVKRVPDTVARTVYLQQIAEQTEVPLDVLSQQLDELQVTPAASQPETGPNGEDEGRTPAWPSDDDLPPDTEDNPWIPAEPNVWQPASTPIAASKPYLSRFDRAERALLHYAFTDAETALHLQSDTVNFLNVGCASLAAAWLDFLQDNPVTIGMTPDYQGFIATLDATDADLATAIVTENLPPLNEFSITELEQVISQGDVSVRLSSVRAEMNQAKRLGDKEKQAALATQYVVLMRQKQNEL